MVVVNQFEETMDENDAQEIDLATENSTPKKKRRTNIEKFVDKMSAEEREKFDMQLGNHYTFILYIYTFILDNHFTYTFL
jgi:hypothetical protein